MRQLLPLTSEQLSRAEELLLNPPAGSRIAAARDYGIDLTLVLDQLRRTPAERARLMYDACVAAELARGSVRRNVV